MKIIRLFLFLFLTSFTFNIMAQSCELENLTVRLNPCDGEEFSINYDFTFSDPTSSEYRLFVDGEEIGVYPYHIRNVEVALDGLVPRNILVRVEDSTNAGCSAETSFNFLGCDPGSCNITINNVDTDNSSCNGDGTFDIVVDYDFSFANGTLLNVYANGVWIETVEAVDTQSLYLLSFIKGAGGIETLTLSVADFPACSAEFDFETVDCSGCNISNIEVEISDCSNGEFYATIDFDIVNSTSTFILGGNGETYGNFSYDDLPVTIGPLTASPDIEYEFLIIDVNASQCFNFYNLGVVVCNDAECLITNLSADNMACNGESAYDITINFDASGTPSNDFEISLNGNVIDTVTLADLPYLIENIEATSPGSDIVTICAVGDTECCETINIQRPNCSCELSSLQVLSVGCEDNDEDYFVELRLVSSLGAGTSFEVSVNGITFTTLNDVQGTFELRDINLGVGAVDNITICSTLDPDCCISVDVTKPNCEFVCPIEAVEVIAGACDGLLFPATITVDYTGADTDFLIIEVNSVIVGTFPASSFPGTVSGLLGDGETDYNVEVFTADRSCSQSFLLEAVDCSLSITEGVLNGEISSRIYNGELIMDYSVQSLERADCSLIDMSGRTLWSQKNVELNGTGSQRFQVNGLTNGVYILRMNNENFVYVNKILAR